MTVLSIIYNMGKRLKFSDQIRQAIDVSGLSRYEICKRMEFSESVMSKFMAGKSGLKIRTLDKLADVIGMSVVSSRGKKNIRKKAR